MWILIVMIGIMGRSSAVDQRLLVVVYTEASHPECVSFFHNSVKNSLKVHDLDRIVRFIIVPYGDTQRINEYPFYFCGHTKFGCYANRLQSCAVFNIKKYFNYMIVDSMNYLNGLYVWNRIDCIQ